MVEEEEFDKLGADEREKQERFRAVIREGMQGMAEELNVERLTWVAGIHRNSQNSHAHVVMRKDALERNTGRQKRIGRIRKELLPHKEIEDGKERLVPGKIGERFLAALRQQQALYLGRDQEQERARQAWEQLVRRTQERRESSVGRNGEDSAANRGRDDEGAPVRQRQSRDQQSRGALDRQRIAASWNSHDPAPEVDSSHYRITLGQQLALSMRLAFTQVWYDRAVDHGETYRFNVLDQSTDEERRISEVDIHRRAAARSSRISQGDPALRNQAIDADLNRHGETLRELAEAREAKIAALEKDIASLGSKLSRTGTAVLAAWQTQEQENRTPLLDRATLSELQEQAVRLNLPQQTSELEQLRIALAQEHQAPTRTEDEAGTLVAQLNVARADYLASDARLERFEASVHLTTYEIQDERWSLGALDKQIARRHDDAKLIPRRAERLDLRSLARLNYSAQAREQAGQDVEHLRYVRSEIVREIERRREPLIADRDLAREMVDLLEGVHRVEQETRVREGKTMPEPTYESHQMRTLEASAETLRDSTLLREVHHWEKTTGRNESETSWEGRAVAREIISGLAVEETKERLERFLESQRVTSLHLGNHRTATLREVQARNLTEYLANAILDTREQRDHRQAVKVAAREHHGRLVNEFEKAGDYHAAAREMASEAKGREPSFTDREKINLEIYAERQGDLTRRDQYLEMSRGEGQRQDRDASASRSR